MVKKNSIKYIKKTKKTRKTRKTKKTKNNIDGGGLFGDSKEEKERKAKIKDMKKRGHVIKKNLMGLPVLFETFKEYNRETTKCMKEVAGHNINARLDEIGLVKETYTHEPKVCKCVERKKNNNHKWCCIDKSKYVKNGFKDECHRRHSDRKEVGGKEGKEGKEGKKRKEIIKQIKEKKIFIKRKKITYKPQLSQKITLNSEKVSRCIRKMNDEEKKNKREGKEVKKSDRVIKLGEFGYVKRVGMIDEDPQVCKCIKKFKNNKDGKHERWCCRVKKKYIKKGFENKCEKKPERKKVTQKNNRNRYSSTYSTYPLESG